MAMPPPLLPAPAHAVVGRGLHGRGAGTDLPPLGIGGAWANAMTLGQLCVLYLLAGCAVAVAVYATMAAPGRAERVFQVATAVVFWPMHLALLLSRGASDPERMHYPTPPPSDELARAIAQVDGELAAALHSLASSAQSVLAREK